MNTNATPKAHDLDHDGHAQASVPPVSKESDQRSQNDVPAPTHQPTRALDTETCQAVMRYLHHIYDGAALLADSDSGLDDVQADLDSAGGAPNAQIESTLQHMMDVFLPWHVADAPKDAAQPTGPANDRCSALGQIVG